jgi:peroxiredoxin
MSTLPSLAALPSRRHFLSLLPPLLLAPLADASHAATPATPAVQTLAGQSANGQDLSLSALQGRVVLVFFWATGCAVCRDKMSELRANVAGWEDQPFSLLGVNMDTRHQDLVDYERLLTQTVPEAQRLVSIWAGGPGFKNSLGTPEHLPSTALINKQGQLVRRYSGRIPPAAWDDIAELL